MSKATWMTTLGACAVALSLTLGGTAMAETSGAVKADKDKSCASCTEKSGDKADKKEKRKEKKEAEKAAE